jgi:hypothetical protein
MKLYQNITEKKMDNFLKTLGSSIEKEKLVEIMNDKDDLHGDFIVIKGYKFKKVYGEYQCLQTPTEKHEKVELRWPKAPGDVYKKR